MRKAASRNSTESPPRTRWGEISGRSTYQAVKHPAWLQTGSMSGAPIADPVDFQRSFAAHVPVDEYHCRVVSSGNFLWVTTAQAVLAAGDRDEFVLDAMRLELLGHHR